jgi:acyl-CoA synthetase (AMP-forming)/AMP-acid ligase II
MNIKQLLTNRAAEFGAKSAIIFEGKTTTFFQLRDNSFKISNYLLSRGITGNDKAALFLSNTPEAICGFLGIFSAGVACIPLDYMLTEAEVINFLNHSETRVLFMQPKKGLDINNIKVRCPALQEIIVCREKMPGFPYLNDILENGKGDEPVAEINGDDLSSIFYTSGSTGHPKGVMLSYKHLDNPVKTIGHFLTVGDNDIYLCGGVPFSHLGGLDYVLLMLYFGSTLVLIERFHPVEFLKSLAQYKVTIFCIVPAMYVAILSLKEYDVFDLSSLRYAVVFGAPSSPALLARFQKAYPGAKLLNGWGMTETSAPNTFSPDDVTKLASIGKFDFNMQAKLIDDQNKEAARGELLVKGEGVMMGYYKSEQLTAQILTGGWLKTGDIARRDSDGLYYLVGRKKDMLKVAGEIVFCAEVEEKIQMHPAVKEAAVIGVPDKLRGEVPRAFIVLKEGAMFGEAELLNFLKGNLAHFKIPHYFEFIKELPKNKTGKVDKAKLKEKAR